MATTLTDALAGLRAAPRRAAVLLDVDGTLAPIEHRPDEADVPEPTRQTLIEIARRYAVTACVTGRRAADARRLVGIGTISYVGAHGAELLRAGATTPELDPAVRRWRDRMRAFAAGQDTPELRRLRVRIEDKDAIFAFHWRGAPHEQAARRAVDGIARDAQEAGLGAHWGRKVLEIRPPVHVSKGKGIIALLDTPGTPELDAALYAGDDVTDLDAFAGLDRLLEEGRLRTAVRVGVSSAEGPARLVDDSDLVVEGTEGVQSLLRALLD
jgi:trehalose 6-phosphate phosphatase